MGSCRLDWAYMLLSKPLYSKAQEKSIKNHLDLGGIAAICVSSKRKCLGFVLCRESKRTGRFGTIARKMPIYRGKAREKR